MSEEPLEYRRPGPGGAASTLVIISWSLAAATVLLVALQMMGFNSRVDAAGIRNQSMIPMRVVLMILLALPVGGIIVGAIARRRDREVRWAIGAIITNCILLVAVLLLTG